MKRKSKQAPKTRPRLVECDAHGSTPGCIICQHLGNESNLGYWAIKPDSDGPAQAWCEKCDAALEADRGWSDRGLALADFTIYCTICYARTLARHEQLGWDAVD
ncbi:MAG: hypothetical protein L0211_06960, partial [Planctomycetaceae bacterium]|nr:hypothetical protein [Planctomycetaceae bacterium]